MNLEIKLDFTSRLTKQPIILPMKCLELDFIIIILCKD